MDRPTRQEQARAILARRGRAMAAEILGRRPVGEADFALAFNLEHIDLVSEIPGPAALLSLGRNVTGPRDGLYVIDDGSSWRVYVQERGIETHGKAGLTFDEARDTVIDWVIWLQGLPFRPQG